MDSQWGQEYMISFLTNPTTSLCTSSESLDSRRVLSKLTCVLQYGHKAIGSSFSEFSSVRHSYDCVGERFSSDHPSRGHVDQDLFKPALEKVFLCAFRGLKDRNFLFPQHGEFPLLAMNLPSMPVIYRRPGGAVNNHEKPQRSTLEENVGTRNPTAPAKKR
jgi:hypothetical protein